MILSGSISKCYFGLQSSTLNSSCPSCTLITFYIGDCVAEIFPLSNCHQMDSLSCSSRQFLLFSIQLRTLILQKMISFFTNVYGQRPRAASVYLNMVFMVLDAGFSDRFTWVNQQLKIQNQLTLKLSLLSIQQT